MATWKKVLVVALAAVVGVVPALAQLCYIQTLPEPVSVLPIGEKLPDYDLALVEGESDPLTIVATMVVGGVLGAGVDLFVQGVMIAAGWKTEIDLRSAGIAVGFGALTGPVLAPKPAVTLVRSAMAQGSRWTVRAIAAPGSVTVAAAQRVHEALHTVYVALHNYVREPLERFFRSAWNWVTRR